MEYIKGTVYTSTDGLELLTAKLMEVGISAFEINDPRDVEELMRKKNEYDWDYVDDKVLLKSGSEPSVSFYLSADDEGEAVCLKVKEAVAELAEALAGSVDMGRLRCETEKQDDSEWKDKWKEYFKPAHITDRLVVKPTWEEYTGAEGELVIEIDPGAAFGTGTHPTTTGCIVLLEKYLKPDMRVMDVGCGSGILSIAAALLGAGDVLGIEIDPQAVEVGRENVALNGLADRVRVQLGDMTKGVDYTADVIVANLMADLVKMLAVDAARHLEPDGLYICSGILLELCGSVCSALEDCGFEVIDVYKSEKDGGWCAIAAKNNASRSRLKSPR